MKEQEIISQYVQGKMYPDTMDSWESDILPKMERDNLIFGVVWNIKEKRYVAHIINNDMEYCLGDGCTMAEALTGALVQYLTGKVGMYKREE